MAVALENRVVVSFRSIAGSAAARQPPPGQARLLECSSILHAGKGIAAELSILPSVGSVGDW
jgi:hypothetical protein